jgi:Flp pilus assembly protein TadG
MRIRKTVLRRGETGQSLVETVLMMPLLLLLLLNTVNFGYFFLATLNLTAAPRTGVEYAVMGFDTPSAISLPASGPPSGPLTVGYLTQQDMTGALSNPTGASIQICTQTNLSAGSGVNGTGANQRANCTTCTGATCTGVGGGGAGIVPHPDPEAPVFILNRVDVTYTFIPLIPGRPFNLFLMASPICNAAGSSCTFHRFAEMRTMN